MIKAHTCAPAMSFMALSIAQRAALGHLSVSGSQALRRDTHGWRCRTTDHVRVLNSAMPVFKSTNRKGF